MGLSTFLADFPSNEAILELNHWCDCFSKLLDPRFPAPLFQELASSVFADANHGRDNVAGKAVIGFLAFVASAPAG